MLPYIPFKCNVNGRNNVSKFNQKGNLEYQKEVAFVAYKSDKYGSW